MGVLLARAHERRDPVEEPSEARAGKAADPGVELAAERGRRGAGRGHGGEPVVPGDARLAHERERHAPRPPHRRVAAGKREGGEGRDVCERRRRGLARDTKPLAAGDARARRTGEEAGAVEGRHERVAAGVARIGRPAIGHHRRRVGLVMADAFERRTEPRGQGRGEPAGVVAGVEIGGHDRGAHPEQPQEMPDRGLERLE